MELSPQEVRDIRFGTTRLRAGYNMSEVDAFLDTIEAALESYSSELRHTRDEADALRSQVQQLQARLASAQAELDECRALSAPRETVDGHDTIVTVVKDEVDTETTAENPVVGVVHQPEWGDLIRVRDDVRRMLTEQLKIVEDLDLEPR